MGLNVILLRKMMQSAITGRSAISLQSYEDAVKTLHSLQSNAAYLQSVTKQSYQNDAEKLKDTEKYLIRSGVSLEQLAKLSVIHVAGTKGKGSTCAFTEAILRKHGLCTGFFSSPHLITVRERIRINGSPLSESAFAHHFWTVYKKLNDAKEHKSDMPTYFKFLTVLMFNVFLQAKIDVAIIEVGIGGVVDCTNIIRNPVCVGITSLGLDHTYLLGHTLAEIAYQKSGIFKPKTTAFTVPQPKEAMEVLKKRAIERDCNLYIVPPLKSYPWKNGTPILGVASNVQEYNASLAIKMATHWIEAYFERVNTVLNNSIPRKPYDNVQEITLDKNNIPNDVKQNKWRKADLLSTTELQKIALALTQCKWPGRTQILKSKLIDFYLDGAHTVESMQCCISWFQNVTNRNKGKRILIFNITGNRNPAPLLTLLKSVDFHKAYFVPNFAGISSIDDQLNLESLEEQKVNCRKHCELWGEDSALGNNVTEVLNDIKKECATKADLNCLEKDQLLVTGSLHLVGAVLAVLDPNFTMTTNF